MNEWAGPCGVYRYAPIRESAVPFYLDLLHQNPDTAGMLLGSLLLAEDRILSYAAVLKAESKGACTAYVPEGTFYCRLPPLLLSVLPLTQCTRCCVLVEAETDPEKLLTQRRRWINGTIAGYIWLIQNAGLIFNSSLPRLQKLLLTFLIVSQLMMYVVVILSPSLCALALYLSLVPVRLGNHWVASAQFCSLQRLLSLPLCTRVCCCSRAVFCWWPTCCCTCSSS
jgi:cellulose synthase/poly-beta-1,6-N-acetylglucosamine synthase-like glycosyltransferase